MQDIPQQLGERVQLCKYGIHANASGKQHVKVFKRSEKQLVWSMER
jgi:hypothetical protein